MMVLGGYVNISGEGQVKSRFKMNFHNNESSVQYWAADTTQHVSTADPGLVKVHRTNRSDKNHFLKHPVLCSSS